MASLCSGLRGHIDSIFDFEVKHPIICLVNHSQGGGKCHNEGVDAISQTEIVRYCKLA
jgi:hypothetical protein